MLPVAAERGVVVPEAVLLWRLRRMPGRDCSVKERMWKGAGSSELRSVETALERVRGIWMPSLPSGMLRPWTTWGFLG